MSPSSNSPQRYERPSSRSSGRSIRASSPALSLEDPVAVRNQISTLKHSIRHQQAQVTDLETHIRSSSIASMSTSSASSSTLRSPPPSYTPLSTTPTNTNGPKVSRRTSYEVLQGIAGPDSNLPLPMTGVGRANGSLNGSSDENGIREGVPTSPTSYKRLSSPTRTLSRIPVASVGNARALADEGALSPNTSIRVDTSITSPTSPSLQPPSPSPNSNRRISLTPGGTTKVLADLQTGVVNARNALENTKAQLRLSQRSVATLTRQTEDLKEGRERLRLENEGLNNVVARKERLLQEVLDRARKAESEATLLRTQLKSETSQSKKSLRELESALSESTALSQKSEREYLTLRESLKHLTESWANDTHRLREEIRKREEKWLEEKESLGKKYRRLVEEVKASREGSHLRQEIERLREEDRKKAKEIEERWVDEIKGMKEKVEKSEREGEEFAETARQLAAELAQLRRSLQDAGRIVTADIPSPKTR